MPWKNKVVVVTGGSEGLGREIAFAFARQSATVVIAARNKDRLQETTEHSASLGWNLDWMEMDVTDDNSVNEAIKQIISRHGQIDIWVNNVGKSTRVALENCDLQLYRELMEINFFAVVRCTTAVLKHLKSTSGQVVNIGSLACKTGWPHVAPYVTSKHAMAGFSHQLRVEGPRNVNCLLVCPGPIRRSDSATRYSDQAAGLSETAQQPGAGVKLKGICPIQLSSKIERACRRRKKEIVVPGYTKILFALNQLSPRLGVWILKKFKK